MNEAFEDLNKKLVEARKSKGYTQVQLAQMIGVDPSTIAKIEQGRTSPSVETLGKWAEACDLAFEVNPRVPRNELSPDDRALLERLVDLLPKLDRQAKRIIGSILEGYESVGVPG